MSNQVSLGSFHGKILLETSELLMDRECLNCTATKLVYLEMLGNSRI